MYKEYINKLKEVCLKRGIKLQKVGMVGRNFEYPIFKVIIGKSKNPAICFSAGIHGEEPAGPWAILEFLKKINLKEIKRTRIILLPVINPHGFDRGVRRNFLNRDLNRHFCDKKLTDENKICYESIRREKIIFFHAIHEDKGAKRFYLYNFENKEEKIYRDLVQLAKKYFPINNAKKIYGETAKGGIVSNQKDGSFEDRMFRDGVPYSLCTETPEAQPFQERVKLNVVVMRLILGWVDSQV